MKEPWTVYLPCCCCCRPKRDGQQPPKPDPERGDDFSTPNSVHEISPAERAIDIALRHSQEIPEPPEPSDPNPPPSYDSVLKDDDRRNPQRWRPAELQGSAAARAPPPPPAVVDQKDGHGQQQESVFSDDEDVVLTPPTTAPPTVLDEDSEDERINGTFRGR